MTIFPKHIQQNALQRQKRLLLAQKCTPIATLRQKSLILVQKGYRGATLRQIITFLVQKQKKSTQNSLNALWKLAATYSPTWYSSTIGANGLNFSVRDGKRWIPVAITTIIYLFCSSSRFCRSLTADHTVYDGERKNFSSILLRVSFYYTRSTTEVSGY